MGLDIISLERFDLDAVSSRSGLSPSLFLDGILLLM